MGDVNSKESSSATAADAEKTITPLSPQTMSRRESEKQKAARRSTILELSGRLLPNVNNRHKLPPPSAYDSTDDEELNSNKTSANPEPKVIQQIKKEETPPSTLTPLPSPDEHNPASPSPFLTHDQATHLQIRSSIENTLNMISKKPRRDRHSILLEQSSKHLMKKAVYSRAEGERDFSAVEEQSIANATEENTSANSSFASSTPFADLRQSDPNNSAFSLDNDDSTASTPVLTPITTPLPTPMITPQPSFEDVLSPLAAKHFNETSAQPILDVNLIDFGESTQPSSNIQNNQLQTQTQQKDVKSNDNDAHRPTETAAPVSAFTENQGGYFLDEAKDKLSQSAPDVNKPTTSSKQTRPPPNNFMQHAATLRNSEPTKKNATMVISGGYSSKSTDFLDSRPRGRSNTTVAARTVTPNSTDTPQSPPASPRGTIKEPSPVQSDAEEEEDEVVFLEALVNWRKLPTEDIVEYGLQLSNQYPGLIKKMRDDLKGRVKAREESQKPVNNAGNLDWNSHFQQLLEELHRCDDSFDRTKIYSQLTNLAQDFIHCAKTYGKLIISEVYLPVEEKTVKPTQMGGFAGGLKYVVKNILFKFALDQNGLYGSDMIAAKVAGHDLRGLIQYFNLGIPDLHFPLMALVDYMGFRLQALSLLPINSGTIIYGTPDGGRTIYDNDPKFNMKMKLAAQKLNLKTHVVGLKKSEGKLLYSCADIEGHDGLDGRFYLLDFARSMPPLDVDNVSHFKNAHLFRLFRPEFVKKYTMPLCSDTFSGFVANHNPLEHIREIQEATKYLHTKVIPQVVAELNSVQSEEELTQLSIKATLHKKGVNLSMMGLLRQYVTQSGVKKKLLREMIARVAKHQINERLRAKMKELKLALQEPYKDVVIDYLNELFGTSERSKTYWNQHLKRHILSNFPFGLSIEESDVEYDLKGNYVATNSLCLLFRQVKKMSGLKFTSISSTEFSKNPQSFAFKTPFDDTDLDELGEKVKHLNIMAASMGYYLTDKALVKTGANAKRLFCLAIERFQEALESNPEDKTTLRELARVQAVLKETGLAKKYYKEAIDADPSDPITHFRYAVFLEELGEVDQAEEHFFKSLECDPDDHHTLFQYADFLFRRGKVEESEKFYELARRHSTMTSVAEEEIYENERKAPTSSEFSKEHLLISDYRGAWSTRRGTPIRKDDIRLPSNWEWVGDWSVDKSKRPCDPEGWQYAVAWRSDWVPYRFNGALVRRRRWKRARKNKLTNDDLPDIKIEELVMRLRDPVHGIQLRDRKHFLRTYEDCFTGTEAVQWMVQTYGINVAEAIKLGNKLIELKYIHHVTYEHVFADAYLFYQFTNQEETQVKFMRHMSKTESRAKDFNSIKKQGFLEKQGFIVQSWKKRWFVLKKGSLYYYKRPQDGSPKGIISLVQTSVVPYTNVSGHQTHADPQLLFTIKTGVRNFHLKASTPTERDDWVKTISANCIT